MKHVLLCVLSVLLLGLDAAPGCIGPREFNDLNGQPQYSLPGPVRCNCPCTVIGEEGRCVQCGHHGELTRGRSFSEANNYSTPDYSGALRRLARKDI